MFPRGLPRIELNAHPRSAQTLPKSTLANRGPSPRPRRPPRRRRPCQGCPLRRRSPCTHTRPLRRSQGSSAASSEDLHLSPLSSPSCSGAPASAAVRRRALQLPRCSPGTPRSRCRRSSQRRRTVRLWFPWGPRPFKSGHGQEGASARNHIVERANGRSRRCSPFPFFF